MTEEVWDRQIDFNLKTAFLGCKYALPIMVAQGKGAIVNIASVAGLRNDFSSGRGACRICRQQGRGDPAFALDRRRLCEEGRAGEHRGARA